MQYYLWFYAHTNMITSGFIIRNIMFCFSIWENWFLCTLYVFLIVGHLIQSNRHTLIWKQIHLYWNLNYNNYKHLKTSPFITPLFLMNFSQLVLTREELCDYVWKYSFFYILYITTSWMGFICWQIMHIMVSCS